MIVTVTRGHVATAGRIEGWNRWIDHVALGNKTSCIDWLRSQGIADSTSAGLEVRDSDSWNRLFHELEKVVQTRISFFEIF